VETRFPPRPTWGKRALMHAYPIRRMGRAAGASCKVAGRGRGVAHPLPHPRSAHYIPRALRHRLRERGRRDHPHPRSRRRTRMRWRNAGFALCAKALDRLLIVNERRPRQVFREYVAYDNQRRAHQSVGQRCAGPGAPASVDSIVARRYVLGDLVHAYDRVAACNASFCYSSASPAAVSRGRRPGNRSCTPDTSASHASGPLATTSGST